MHAINRLQLATVVVLAALAVLVAGYHLSSAALLPDWGTLWFLPFCLPICLWVAWSDLKFMKIPNAAVIATLVVFVVIGPLALPLDAYLWRFPQVAVVLAVGFVLNLTGAFGAGDAKFAAAMAAFIPLTDFTGFAFLFAGVLLAAFAVHRAVRAIPALRAPVEDWKSWHVKDFPMGLALGTSLAMYLATGIASAA